MEVYLYCILFDLMVFMVPCFTVFLRPPNFRDAIIVLHLMGLWGFTDKRKRELFYSLLLLAVY